MKDNKSKLKHVKHRQAEYYEQHVTCAILTTRCLTRHAVGDILYTEIGLPSAERNAHCVSYRKRSDTMKHSDRM